MQEETNPVVPLHVAALVQRAATVVGGMNQLAKLLDVKDNVPREWKAGRRPCSPEDRARLAGLAREDALQELVRATLEKTEGTRRGDQLRILLGKPLPPIGGAAASVLLALASLIFLILPSQNANAAVIANKYNEWKRQMRRSLAALAA